MTQPPSPPTLRSGKLCYLEIPALDVHTSAAFYERVFGWNIRFRDTDRPSFDDTTGEVSGAWVRDRTPDPDPGIVPHIMVADAAAVAQAVIAAGGHIVLPAGQYGGEVLATFLDSAGNLMADPKLKAQVYAELGVEVTYNPEQRMVLVSAGPTRVQQNVSENRPARSRTKTHWRLESW
jgi:predicted enzyme related to lactoylglutathione lyase